MGVVGFYISFVYTFIMLIYRQLNNLYLLKTIMFLPQMPYFGGRMGCVLGCGNAVVVGWFSWLLARVVFVGPPSIDGLVLEKGWVMGVKTMRLRHQYFIRRSTFSSYLCFLLPTHHGSCKQIYSLSFQKLFQKY